MADQKISELTNITGANLADADEFVVVDTSADQTKAVTRAEFFKNTPKIGVGTDSPTQELEVHSTGDATVLVKTSGTGDADATLQLDSAASGESMVEFLHDGVSGAGIQWFTDGGPDLNIFTTSESGGQIDFQPSESLAMRITADGNVGIGTSSPSATLDVVGTTGLNGNTTVNNGWLKVKGVTGALYLEDTDVSASSRIWQVGENLYIDNQSAAGGDIFIRTDNGKLRQIIRDNGDISFRNTAGSSDGLHWDAADERLGLGTANPSAALDVVGDIEVSGNLLVGKTNSNFNNTAGIGQFPSGRIYVTRDDGNCLYLNRVSSDGDIAAFYKDSGLVGNIGTKNNDLSIGTGDTALAFYDAGSAILPYNTSTSGYNDNSISLGNTNFRFDDIYATNGTIQTSDRNEKQDIEALSDAETRVAQACKGLLRKFRWVDAVAEKGDDARIHFGIIAQDLQDAFTAEGLDAGRYAMFISSTWWETQTEVPAVEAVAEVLDDEGNVVTEAVEAKEAYTRTDTYETQEEAPEGATERTRLGVRYPELLAFIIAAI